MELFKTISGNYSLSSSEMWYWLRYKNILIKAIMIFWILPISIILKIISFIFSLGIFLDSFSSWLWNKRDNALYSLESSTYGLSYKKTSYILTPIEATLLFPYYILLGIIPKFSSVVSGNTDNNLDLGHGYFFKLGNLYLNLAKELLFNSFKHGILFFPIAIIITILIAPLSTIVGIFFYLFIVLDLFGWFIVIIREFIVTSSGKLARTSSNNFFTIIINPPLLIILSPMYLLLIFIPKFSTYDNS